MLRFLLGLIVLLWPAAAQAEKRIALLIGNQAYVSDIGPLKNPHKDIRVVAAALAKVGFEKITQIKDANRDQILGAIHDFADQLGAAGEDPVGFFYYSGHGLAVAGDNFIVPINVKAMTRRDLDVFGVKLDDILGILNDKAPQAAHFVIFDACRSTLAGTRGSKGFVPAVEKAGALIGFSTAPGATASDQGQDGGPYATALAAELVVPGRSHSDVFFEVRTRVATASRHEQIPWTQDGLLRRITFAKESAKSAAPAAAKDPAAVRQVQDAADAEPTRREFTDPAVHGFPLAYNSPGLESNWGVADAFCQQEGYARALAYLTRLTDGRKHPVMKLRGGELCGHSSCLTLTRIDCVGAGYITRYSPPSAEPLKDRATFLEPLVDGYAVYFSSPGLQNNKGVADAFCHANGFAGAMGYLTQITDGRRVPVKKLGSGELCGDGNCLTLTRIDCAN